MAPCIIVVVVLVTAFAREGITAEVRAGGDPGQHPRPGIGTGVVDGNATLRLQVFLDRQGFSPGILDGRPGLFLTKAVARWQQAHGLAVTGIPDHEADLPPDQPTLVPYTIAARDQGFVGPCPTEPADQAKVQSLPYRTMLEFLGERFHCTPKLLQARNPGLTSENPLPGTTLLVPNVEPFCLESLDRRAGIAANASHPALRHRIIQVHRAERMLDVWDGALLVASFPVTPGGGTVETPVGTWRVVSLAVAPTFRWDRSVLETGRRSDTFFLLPPGPNNPVGVLWCALNRPGIGIHGTETPHTIGRAASHGCVRMANWDIVRLAGLITPGVRVIID